MLIISALIIRNKRSEISVNIELPTVDSAAEFGNVYKREKGPLKSEKGVYKAASLFVFDPNLITEKEALLLGFSPKTAAVLVKFRNKGGKFRQKDDLKKIYGVTEKLFSRVEPYIMITNYAESKKDNEKVIPDFVNRQKKSIELNSADSIQLVSLNGIGPKLSARIIAYRKSLGGFSDVSQLKEIYGMKDSLFVLFADKVSVDQDKIQKIKINTITLDELKKHAYIKYIIAQSIVNYRQKHGRFQNEKELVEVGSISEELMNKLRPYLNYD